jgi:hypothetical protein
MTIDRQFKSSSSMGQLHTRHDDFAHRSVADPFATAAKFTATRTQVSA